MTKYAATSPVLISTDATFRTVGTLINAGFAAVGLVQTSDTGQINWTTVSKPVAANATAGYEIWRFDDSLQSTAPIFMKIWYKAAGNTSGNNFALDLEVATGSNGTGTLTGAGTALGAWKVGAVSGFNTAELLVAGWSFQMCGLSGYFGATSKAQDNTEGTRVPFTFAVMRTVDANGAPTAEGCYIWNTWESASNVQPVASRSINFTTATAYAMIQAASAMPADMSNFDTGNYSYVGLHYACIPNPVPVIGVLSTRYVAGMSGSTFTCAAVGATPRTYLTKTETTLFNALWGSNSTNSNASAYRAFGMLWE